jgi:hypothetical protein
VNELMTTLQQPDSSIIRAAGPWSWEGRLDRMEEQRGDKKRKKKAPATGAAKAEVVDSLCAVDVGISQRGS